MSLDVRTPLGMSWPEKVRWDDEVADIRTSFEFELCHECGKDIGAHVISPGPLGNAMAWCKQGAAS